MVLIQEDESQWRARFHMAKRVRWRFTLRKVFCAILTVESTTPCSDSEKSQMAYVIAEPCIGTKDTACVDACPVDCIHPKKDEAGHGEADQLFIDPVECIDCGACVPACPVSAIFAADDLPEKWAHFTEKNATHFGR
jgi:NAD-dependent dihydropyrimidine dehydrogenase PreA subunit